MKKKIINQKVWVHWNFHKKCFSIKYKNEPVIHADLVQLENVKFHVRPNGRKKVLKEKVKNVHAFVIGTLLDYMPKGDICGVYFNGTYKKIDYNPYISDSFYNKKTKKPIFEAKKVILHNTTKDKIMVST
jgi:hypothetical protein